MSDSDDNFAPSSTPARKPIRDIACGTCAKSGAYLWPFADGTRRCDHRLAGTYPAQAPFDYIDALVWTQDEAKRKK